MLKEEQVLLLNILKESLQGKSYDLTFPGNDSFLRLMKLAQEQQLLPSICEAIYQSECLRNSRVFTSFKNKAIQQAAMHKIRTEEFLNIYRKLQKEGITPLVVKGIVCQSLYPNTLLRIAVDDDLFVPDHSFTACHHFLLDYGLNADTPVTNINSVDEISYHQEESPIYIELHRTLFPKTSSAYGHFNKLFKQASARSVWVQTENSNIKTLCPTDHLLYLILHAFKHFLHSGIGIRPLCDIALFAERYNQEIDWNHIKTSLISINAFDYARALFCIIDLYLMPDASYSKSIAEWDIRSIDSEALLQDILESGIHGASSMSRLHSSTITLNAVTNRKKDTSIMHSIFLPMKSMKSKYPYLNKFPLLLPFAWIQRSFHYIQELRHSTSNDVIDSIQIGKNRIKLLRQYNVIN